MEFSNRNKEKLVAVGPSINDSNTSKNLSINMYK